jgi:hypothetical protein
MRVPATTAREVEDVGAEELSRAQALRKRSTVSRVDRIENEGRGKAAM